MFPGLPPLPPLTAARVDLVRSHQGPTPRSNWVVPGHLLAGDRSGLDGPGSLPALLATGITTIVCLQARSELKTAVDYRARAQSISPQLRFREQPIPDQETVGNCLIEELLVELLDRLGAGEIIYVHCRGGHGRTGTVCTLLLGRLYRLSSAEAMVRVQRCHDARQQPVFCASAVLPALPRELLDQGSEAESSFEDISPGDAVCTWATEAAPALCPPQVLQVLQMLPLHREAWPFQGHSTGETEEGETAREDRGHNASAKSQAAQAARPTEARAIPGLPRFVMLVGLPGSGKSTFSAQLELSGRGWVRVSQDELGGRAAVESVLGSLGKDASKRVVFDRCNETKEDRRYMLNLAFNPRPAVVVYFDVDAETCEGRVAARTNHPTIPYGGGRGAVRSKAASFQVPSLDEGFDAVIVVQSFEEANALLCRWGSQAPQGLSPLGLVRLSSPALLQLQESNPLLESETFMSAAEASWFFDHRRSTVIEEWPLDGLLCAISVTSSYEMQIQDMTNYLPLDDEVDAALGDGPLRSGELSHIRAWREKHGATVCSLLEPEVEVLMGLWCCQRRRGQNSHGLVALELYNKRAGRRHSARERDRRLQGIPLAPRLAECSLAHPQELQQLMSQTSSRFNGEPVRGVFLCIDEPDGLWQERRARVALRTEQGPM